MNPVHAHQPSRSGSAREDVRSGSAREDVRRGRRARPRREKTEAPKPSMVDPSVAIGDHPLAVAIDGHPVGVAIEGHPLGVAIEGHPVGVAIDGHPLEHAWTVWYYTDWHDMRPVHSFATIEDFWRTFNNLPPPSRLPARANLCLFRSGMRPVWEDDANRHGGRWIVSLAGKDHGLDRGWQEVLMGMIGETLDVDDQICGAVVYIRNAGDRFALWTRGTDLGVQETLGRRLKGLLDPEGRMRIEFKAHSDAAEQNSCFTAKSLLAI